MGCWHVCIIRWLGGAVDSHAEGMLLEYTLVRMPWLTEIDSVSKRSDLARLGCRHSRFDSARRGTDPALFRAVEEGWSGDWIQ